MSTFPVIAAIAIGVLLVIAFAGAVVYYMRTEPSATPQPIIKGIKGEDKAAATLANCKKTLTAQVMEWDENTSVSNIIIGAFNDIWFVDGLAYQLHKSGIAFGYFDDNTVSVKCFSPSVREWFDTLKSETSGYFEAVYDILTNKYSVEYLKECLLARIAKLTAPCTFEVVLRDELLNTTFADILKFVHAEVAWSKEDAIKQLDEFKKAHPEAYQLARIREALKAQTAQSEEQIAELSAELDALRRQQLNLALYSVSKHN